MADEGIGEHAAFLFDSQTRVITMQRRRASITAGDLAVYCESFSPDDRMIELNVVLRLEAAQRLALFKQYTRFEAKTAGIINEAELTALLRENDEDISTAIKVLARSGAPSMQILMSGGHERATLFKKTVDELIAAFRKIATGRVADVKTLYLEGRNSGGDKLVVDLIEDRLVGKTKVEADRRRHATYESRKKALSSMFGDVEDQLKRQFTSKKK